jgi:hypothetical protein
MQGVAMLLQNRYQRQRLYTRIALGKVSFVASSLYIHHLCSVVMGAHQIKRFFRTLLIFRLLEHKHAYKEHRIMYND